MSQINQVYIVTAGEYSDYHISSIWLSLEEAKAAADKYCRVEVWPIGEGKRTLGGFHRSGDFDVTGRVSGESSYDTPCLQPARADVLCWAGKSEIGIRVTQDTQERAAKVYGEIRTRVLNDIAQGLPPEAIAGQRYENGRWVPTNAS